METQVGRKPPLPLLSLQYFIIEKTSYNICAGAASYQHAGTHLRSFTNLFWKGAMTPCSRLPASPGRELRPPDLIYQPQLEGSYNPLTRLPASPGRELRPLALIYQPHLEGSYDPLTEVYNRGGNTT